MHIKEADGKRWLIVANDSRRAEETTLTFNATPDADAHPLAVSILLGGVLKMRAAKEWTAPAWWVYKYSLLYLALLFVAMAADRKLS